MKEKLIELLNNSFSTDTSIRMDSEKKINYLLINDFVTYCQSLNEIIEDLSLSSNLHQLSFILLKNTLPSSSTPTSDAQKLSSRWLFLPPELRKSLTQNAISAVNSPSRSLESLASSFFSKTIAIELTEKTLDYSVLESLNESFLQNYYIVERVAREVIINSQAESEESPQYAELSNSFKSIHSLSTLVGHLFDECGVLLHPNFTVTYLKLFVELIRLEFSFAPAGTMQELRQNANISNLFESLLANEDNSQNSFLNWPLQLFGHSKFHNLLKEFLGLKKHLVQMYAKGVLYADCWEEDVGKGVLVPFSKILKSFKLPLFLSVLAYLNGKIKLEDGNLIKEFFIRIEENVLKKTSNIEKQLSLFENFLKVCVEHKFSMFNNGQALGSEKVETLSKALLGFKEYYGEINKSILDYKLEIIEAMFVHIESDFLGSDALSSIKEMLLAANSEIETHYAFLDLISCLIENKLIYLFPQKNYCKDKSKKGKLIRRGRVQDMSQQTQEVNFHKEEILGMLNTSLCKSFETLAIYNDEAENSESIYSFSEAAEYCAKSINLILQTAVFEMAVEYLQRFVSINNEGELFLNGAHLFDKTDNSEKGFYLNQVVSGFLAVSSCLEIENKRDVCTWPKLCFLATFQLIENILAYLKHNPSAAPYTVSIARISLCKLLASLSKYIKHCPEAVSSTNGCPKMISLSSQIASLICETNTILSVLSLLYEMFESCKNTSLIYMVQDDEYHSILQLLIGFTENSHLKIMQASFAAVGSFVYSQPLQNREMVSSLIEHLLGRAYELSRNFIKKESQDRSSANLFESSSKPKVQSDLSPDTEEDISQNTYLGLCINTLKLLFAFDDLLYLQDYFSSFCSILHDVLSSNYKVLFEDVLNAIETLVIVSKGYENNKFLFRNSHTGDQESSKVDELVRAYLGFILKILETFNEPQNATGAFRCLSAFVLSKSKIIEAECLDALPKICLAHVQSGESNTEVKPLAFRLLLDLSVIYKGFLLKNALLLIPLVMEASTFVLEFEKVDCDIFNEFLNIIVSFYAFILRDEDLNSWVRDNQKLFYNNVLNLTIKFAESENLDWGVFKLCLCVFRNLFEIFSREPLMPEQDLYVLKDLLLKKIREYDINSDTRDKYLKSCSGLFIN